MKYTPRRGTDVNMKNSYKIVNERILQLKKFEFEFANIMEVFKHYLIVQELVVKGLFLNEVNRNEKSDVSVLFKLFTFNLPLHYLFIDAIVR